MLRDYIPLGLYFILWLHPYIVSAATSTFTVFTVDLDNGIPTQGTPTIKAVSTEANGMTLYQEVEVQSEEIFHLSGSSAITYSSAHATITKNDSMLTAFIPEATRTVDNGGTIVPSPNHEEECQFNKTAGTGSCTAVDLGFSELGPLAPDGVTSWTGSLIPVATITSNTERVSLQGGKYGLTMGIILVLLHVM